MKFVLLLAVIFSLGLAGCARERSGIVTRAEGKNTLRVAGAEVFLVKDTAEAGLLAPAKAAAAAKDKEVNERLKPEIARAELALTRAIEAQSKLPEGKAPNMELGGDEKRNAAMNALMAKQKEHYLARLEVNAAGFDALRRALTQAPVGVTTTDGAFTVTLKSDDVVLILDAKTKSVWRTDPFNGTVTLDEGRRVVFP
jgi:hypothetical protein